MKATHALHLSAFAAICNAWTFKPNNASSVEPTNLPLFYNLTASQIDSSGGSSFYANSFITTTDGRQFSVLSHLLLTPAPKCYARYSIIDLANTTNYWSNLEYYTPPESHASADGLLDINLPNYELKALSPDGYSVLRTAASTDGFGFNITFSSSSPVIYNMGVGRYNFGGGGWTDQWSMPGGLTAGSIALGGERLTVDPANSLTWYDRQTGTGNPTNGNWTWFELHFEDDADLKASVWAVDQRPASGLVEWRFATVRHDRSHQIIPYTLTVDGARTWTSPRSNLTYPLRWNLRFDNGDSLVLSSVRDDQEMYSPRSLADSAYEGVVTVEGNFLGKHRRGFGLAEVINSI